MTTDTLSTFSRRPESEVEWEDLLLRMEVMTRALRVLVGEAAERERVVHEVVVDAVRREVFVRDFLEAAAGLSGAPFPDAQVGANTEDALDRFVRLRARNFAIVQRRGIDVWDWEAEVQDAGSVTVYQVLSALVRADVETLATIRGSSKSGAGVC